MIRSYCQLIECVNYVHIFKKYVQLIALSYLITNHCLFSAYPCYHHLVQCCLWCTSLGSPVVHPCSVIELLLILSSISKTNSTCFLSNWFLWILSFNKLWFSEFEQSDLPLDVKEENRNYPSSYPNCLTLNWPGFYSLASSILYWIWSWWDCNIFVARSALMIYHLFFAIFLI